MVYVDTSALAKWYLNERGSEEFVDWIVRQSEPWISTLTAVELRCLMARKQRNDEISPEIATRAHATFEEDTARGHHDPSRNQLDRPIARHRPSNLGCHSPERCSGAGRIHPGHRRPDHGICRRGSRPRSHSVRMSSFPDHDSMGSSIGIK